MRLEWRSRDAITSMLFFSLLVVVVFAFAFEPTAAVSRQVAGGILWMVLLFAATTALNQSWNREQRNGVLDAQRLAPAAASALFLGKALTNFLFVTFVEVALAPIFVVFYNLHALGQGWLLLAGDAAGDLGAGGEWNVLRGAEPADAQPRADAAAGAVSDRDSGAAGDGAGDDEYPDGGVRAGALDQAAGGIRRHLYDGVPAAVRDGAERGVIDLVQRMNHRCNGRAVNLRHGECFQTVFRFDAAGVAGRRVDGGDARGVEHRLSAGDLHLAAGRGARQPIGRALYWHVPHSGLALIFPYINLVASVAYLYLEKVATGEGAGWRMRGRWRRQRCTVLYGSLCLLTGSLWGKAAWGIWWTWDARLTSMLLLWLLYVAYLMTRTAFGDGQTSTLAAVLSVFAAIDVPIVYMSIRWWRTQHPAPVFFGSKSSGLDPSMRPGVLLELPGLGDVGSVHPGTAVRAGTAEAEVRGVCRAGSAEHGDGKQQRL